MQAVVAFKRFEAGVGNQHSDLGAFVEAETAHSFAVRKHMGLADDGRLVAERLEVVADRQLTDWQRNEVPCRAMAKGRAPGVEGRPRRATNRGWSIGPREPDAALGQPIDVRRVQMRVAVTAEVVETQLVGHDEEDVLDVVHVDFNLLCRGACRCAIQLRGGAVQRIVQERLPTLWPWCRSTGSTTRTC